MEAGSLKPQAAYRVLPDNPSSNPGTSNYRSKRMSLQDADCANARPEGTSSTTPAAPKLTNSEPTVSVSIFAFEPSEQCFLSTVYV